MSANVTVSVIIPARNRAHVLPECLRSLNSSQPLPQEVIVVDDASSDHTSDVARQLGARVIRLDTNHDPNYCRNLGAEHATCNILLFLDSDVIVQSSTVSRVLESFDDQTTDVIVGLYTVHHRFPTVASQYKNLWIRYSYLRSKPELDWIFGAITAIRADIFKQAGGFDHTLFMKYGGEDLEFGKRMTQSKYIIKLNPSVEVEHLKRHTLTSLLRNDYERAQGFVVLAGNLGQLGRSLTKGFANVYPNFAYSVPLSWLILSSAAACFWTPVAAVPLVAGSVVYGGLNGPFLRYYARHRGIGETAQALAVLVLDHLVCGVGTLVGLLKWTSSH